MKYNLTKTAPANKSVKWCTLDRNVQVGKFNCMIETYVVENWDKTFSAKYRVTSDFGWAGGIGIKNITVNAKATAEDAYNTAVKRAENWMAKYLEK